MTRTTTRQITTAKVPGTDFEVTLGHVTQQDESDMFFHITPTHILVAYLVHDDACENPMENHAQGAIFTSARNAVKGSHEGFQKALGLDSDWTPNLNLVDDEKIPVLAAKDVKLSFEGKNEGRLFKAAYDAACINSERKDDESTLDFVLRYVEHSNPEELSEFADTSPYWRQAWEEGRINGTIGAKYAVPLDVHEHGLISYAVSGTGPQCVFDTARGGAVWVADEGCIENFEDKSLSYEDNMKKAREYAKGVAEEYTEWCNGECYGHVVEKFTTEGELIEELTSCWGFIGAGYAKEQCKEQFDYYVKEEGEPDGN